jgi:hypothetical protein
LQKKLPEKKEVQTSDAHHDDQQKLAGYRFARFEVRCTLAFEKKRR